MARPWHYITIQLPRTRSERDSAVEDEEHLARGLKFNLEAEGYPTKVVGDGETALDLLLEQHTEFDPAGAGCHASRQGRIRRCQ